MAVVYLRIMKYLFIGLFLIPVICFSQQKGDSKIIVTINDTSNIYNLIKVALVKSDFIVKEDGNKTVLTTYAAELRGIPGYSIVKAEINGNTVIITGAYGLIKVNDWGYTRTPKSYKRIIYYKGSKSWNKLMDVVDKIEDRKHVSFAK